MRDKVTMTQPVYCEGSVAWIIYEAEVWMSGGPHPATVIAITTSAAERIEYDKTNPIDLPTLDVTPEEMAVLVSDLGVEYLDGQLH